ncbi:hypothetical protein OBBRIDRAFT_706286, partial [Obba rivulosa]
TSPELVSCTTQLVKLPPPLSIEPSAEVLTLVTTFCQEVDSYVQGGPYTAGWVQETRMIYADFKRDMRSTAPYYVVFSNAKQ